MSRSVQVLLGPPWPAEIVRGAHVAVIDVLRATTTIAAALANGAAGVIPVAEPEDAIALAQGSGATACCCAASATPCASKASTWTTRRHRSHRTPSPARRC